MVKRLSGLVLLMAVTGCTGDMLASSYPIDCLSSVPFKPLPRATLTQTGQPLDLAIAGEGYFMLTETGTGKPVYSRHGQFRPSSAGRITTQDGHYELQLATAGELDANPVGQGRYPADPPLVLPSNVSRTVVTADGLVQIGTAAQPALQPFGQVLLTSFPDREGLREVSPHVYEETCVSGAPMIERPRIGSTAGTLSIGKLESEAPAGGPGTIGSPKYHVAP